MNKSQREAALRLADAADDVGVKHFDSDDMPPEVVEMQNAAALLRELLAEPQGEPVAEVFDTFGNSQDRTKCQGKVWLAPGYFPQKGTKLYAAPQQRKPLSDHEIDRAWIQRDCIAAIQAGDILAQVRSVVRAVERKHDIKDDSED